MMITTDRYLCVYNECQVLEMFNLHLNFFIAEIACSQSFLAIILVASARGRKRNVWEHFWQKPFLSPLPISSLSMTVDFAYSLTRNESFSLLICLFVNKFELLSVTETICRKIWSTSFDATTKTTFFLFVDVLLPRKIMLKENFSQRELLKHPLPQE